MPLARVNRVVINLVGCAEGQSVVGAAREHHVGGAASWRHYARQHVNVVVSSAAGAINRQKQLAFQSGWIDSPTAKHATHVDWRYLVERWRLISDLRIARTNAVKDIVKIAFAADEEMPIRGHVESSRISRERNSDRSL